MITVIAWRNLWRRKQRTLFTAVAMGVGVGLAMATTALQTGIFSEMFDEMITDTLGHVQIHHPSYPSLRHLHDTLPNAQELTRATEEISGVRVAVPRLFTVALAGGKERSAGALVMGVDPKREAELSEIDQEVQEGGQWLSVKAKSEVVLGIKLAEELEIKVGEELALVGQDAYGSVAQGLYRVVGLVKSGTVELDQGGVWLHLTDAQTLLALDDQVHELLIAGGQSRAEAIVFGVGLEQVQGLKSQVAQLESLKQLSALTQTWRESKPSLSQFIDTQRSGAYIILFIVLILAALVVLNTMLMSIYERTRELGVMLAVGVKPRTISGLVIVEALYLATIAAVIGVLIGLFLDYLLIRYGLDFSVNGEGLSYGGVRLSPRLYGVFEFKSVVTSVIALYGVTALAALWPAWRAGRLEPVDAIARGERS